MLHRLTALLLAITLAAVSRSAAAQDAASARRIWTTIGAGVGTLHCVPCAGPAGRGVAGTLAIGARVHRAVLVGIALDAVLVDESRGGSSGKEMGASLGPVARIYPGGRGGYLLVGGGAGLFVYLPDVASVRPAGIVGVGWDFGAPGAARFTPFLHALALGQGDDGVRTVALGASVTWR